MASEALGASVVDLTDDIVTVAKYWQSAFEQDTTLDLQDVFYGDQNRIPRTPALCVETGDKRRELNGAPRRTRVDMTIFFLVYHSTIADAQTNRENTDRMAFAVEDFIHQDPDLGGLIVHGMVTSIEPGFVSRGNTMYRASRITYEATSQIQLPSTSGGV